MAKTSKNESYDVSDSTDWLETPFPSLAPIDSALRCQVCRDFYVTPMITSCSHTFCSLCIRHCLGNDGKCPACRKVDDASKLRNNYAIEELVEAFKRARPDIMDYTKKEIIAPSASPKRKHVETEIEEAGSPERKRTRSGRRAQHSSQQVVVVDFEDDDEDYVPKEIIKHGQVRCPICQDVFPTVQAVEGHVDHCDGESHSKKQKPRPNQTSMPPQQVSKPTKRPDRLPQLHYGTVKDNVLRKKLQDLGLAAGGTRQLMERRYTEWVTLWNANCDSRKPKGRGDLKRELDVWERTQGGGALISGRVNPGGNIRDKDFDGHAWSSKHDDSFRQLVEEAKRKRAARTETPQDESKPEPRADVPKSERSSGPAMASNSMSHPVSYSSPYATGHPAQSTALPELQHFTEVEMTLSEVQLTISQSQNKQLSDRVPASPPAMDSHSRRRFVEDNSPPLGLEPSLSRNQNTQILNKDNDISSDMSALRHLQP